MNRNSILGAVWIFLLGSLLAPTTASADALTSSVQDHNKHALSVRSSLRSRQLASTDTFSLPQFSYRMTIIDRDVKMDDFETHLTSITVAHLETALRRALPDVTVNDVRVRATVHRAFLGLDTESGQPEALVNCALAGSVVLTQHGLKAPTARSGDETTSVSSSSWIESGLLRDDIHQIVAAAVLDTDLLYQRFSADSILKIIKDLSVHVKQGNVVAQQKPIDESASLSSVPVTGLLLFSTIVLSLTALVLARTFGITGCKRASGSPDKEGGNLHQERDFDSTLIMEEDDDGEEGGDDDKSTSSCRSSPVFL